MKILFITATRVGDAVLSTGLLNHLIEQNPDAKVTVVCGPAAAGLFESLPGLDRMIILQKKPWSTHWLDMWKTCIGTFWDMVVDLRNAPISYLLACRKSWHLGRSYLSDHRVIRMGAMLGMAVKPPEPKLWCGESHQERALSILPNGRSTIAIAPVANWKPKTWPAVNFVDLVKRLTADNGILPNAKIIVFGTSDERQQATQLLEEIPDDQLIDCMGTLSLLEIYACLERSNLFIGNDSGLMHMAAAAGVPTLGLFGPSKETLYAPWGENAMPVRGDQGYQDLFPEDYNYLESDKLEMMAGLSVDRVEETAKKLWQKVHSA